VDAGLAAVIGAAVGGAATGGIALLTAITTIRFQRGEVDAQRQRDVLNGIRARRSEMLKEWRAGLEEARDKWQKWNESKKISDYPRRSRAFWAMRGSKVFGLHLNARQCRPPG
jgi:hypothetical protein